MSLDFLILYEHIVREYESVTLIKAELERRGYTADIRQLLDMKRLKYFTWKKPKVLVASAMYDDKTVNSFVYNNVGRCNKVVNLHWEQVLSEEQENSPFFNCGGAAAYAVQTCWGQRRRDRLVKYGVPPENVVITGSVTMDFLTPQFEGYYMDKKRLREKFGLDPKKKLALYISSFSTANMSDREVKELNDLAGVGFDNFRVTSARTMETTLDWVERFLSRPGSRNFEFVYRPHPSEWNSPRLYRMEEKYPGFHVISDLPVKQWITASDLIFTWISTSIAEIYFAKKSCYVIRPYPVEEEYDPVVYKDCRKIDNYDDFARCFGREEEPPFPIDTALMEYHYNQTRTPSYIRMADLLEKVLKEDEGDRKPFDHFTPRFSFLKFFSLIGLHAMYALRIDPGKMTVFGPLAEWAGRIYAHIKNTRVSKRERREYMEKIKKFM